MLNEAGGALRELVLAIGTHHDVVLLIPIEVALARVFADAVVFVEPEVEPNGGVERAALIDQQPLELLVEDLGLLFVFEIAVLDAPLGDRAGDAVDDLFEGALTAALEGIVAVVDVAVKVFGSKDFGGEIGESGRDFDVLLLKHGGTLVVGNLGGAERPLDVIIGVNGVGGEGAGYAEEVLWGFGGG